MRATKPAKRGHAAAVASVILYHCVLFVAGVAAMLGAQTLELVGGLFALAALGGVFAVTMIREKRWLSRAALSVSSAISAAGACLLLLPSLPALASVDPATIAIAAVAVTACLTRSRALAWFALASLCVSVIGTTLVGLSAVELILIAFSFGSIFVVARLTHSRLVALFATVIALVAVAGFGMDSGLHPARLLLAFGLGGTALFAVSIAVLQSRLGTGVSIAMIACAALGLQLGLRETGAMDSLWYAPPSASSLTLGAIGLQGLVLVAGLVGWTKGRVGIVGILLMQGVAAALAYCLIRPDLTGNALVSLTGTDEGPAVVMILGGALLGAVIFALGRAWHADRPVETGGLALVVILQSLILMPIVLTDVAAALPALIAASVALFGLHLATRKYI